MSVDDQAASAPSGLSTLFAECERRIGYQFVRQGFVAGRLDPRLGRRTSAGLQRAVGISRATRFWAPWSASCSFANIPQYLEGDLTKIKSVVVSRQTCAKISESLGMQEFLILGKGMTTHPSVPTSLLADVFESLVAAIYLDGGSQAARDFVERHIGPEIELAAERRDGQQLQVDAAATGPAAARHHAHLPTAGRERARITASVSRLPPRSAAAVYQPAWGSNKKEAEQRAAKCPHELTGQVDPAPDMQEPDVE